MHHKTKQYYSKQRRRLDNAAYMQCISTKVSNATDPTRPRLQKTSRQEVGSKFCDEIFIGLQIVLGVCYA